MYDKGVDIRKYMTDMLAGGRGSSEVPRFFSWVHGKKCKKKLADLCPNPLAGPVTRAPHAHLQLTTD